MGYGFKDRCNRPLCQCAVATIAYVELKFYFGTLVFGASIPSILSIGAFGISTRPPILMLSIWPDLIAR